MPASPARRPLFSRSSGWLVLGFCLLVVVWWQTRRNLDLPDQVHAVPTSPPSKTRHAVRPPKTGPGSGVDFASRARECLSDRQIGWMLEDFRNAGLDLGIRMASKEEYLRQRRAMDRWYRKALIDGLNPDFIQAATLTENLGKQFAVAEKAFIEALKSNPTTFREAGQNYQLTGPDPILQLIAPFGNLADNTNPLNPSRLLGRPVESALRTANPESWKPGDKAYPTLQALIDVDAALSPYTKILPPERPADSKDRLLDLCHRLHPAQLEILLLKDPALVASLQQELDGNAN